MLFFCWLPFSLLKVVLLTGLGGPGSGIDVVKTHDFLQWAKAVILCFWQESQVLPLRDRGLSFHGFIFVLAVTSVFV